MDTMQSYLRELLNGKRFLLMLDDVWNGDQDKWDKVKYSLTWGAKGSSIIVTTCLQTVALIVGTLPVYHLPTLSEEECWSLFKGRAFGMGDKGEDINTNLVEIGKQIVRRCGGVPLVAKVLGASLRFKMEVSEWLSIRDSEIWELPEKQGGVILSVLRLSYNHLTPILRQCFSFCSIFPKDYEMEKEELIQLWIANGFAQCDGRTELEDVGNKIFNELLRGSFFQDVQKDDFGNIIKCKMHDLMHDLACSLAANECNVMKVDKMAIVPRSIQHLSLIPESPPTSRFFQSLYGSNQFLRSHLFLGSCEYIIPSHIIFERLHCLRALDLTTTGIKLLPASIGNLKCLRYLNLSKTELMVLPESISRLVNLQMLKLVGCYKLLCLPKYIRNLSNLRHLDIRGCTKLTKMPSGIGQLTCLRTLSIFIVDQKIGRHIKELEGLNHVRGELNIKGLEHVRDSTEAKEANLVSKQNLSSLGLVWQSGGVSSKCLQENSMEGVLECLQPNPSLNRKLCIEGYRGVVFPSWIKSLINLVEIELKGCCRCESLPPLGHLPLLKVLSVSGMVSLKSICCEFYGEGAVKGFLSLEKLYFGKMPSLEKWYHPGSENRREELFPCLKSLFIEHCPKLESLPFLPCLQHLTLSGCTETVITSLRNLSTLSSLVISWSSEMFSFPEGLLRNLSALETLEIRSCYGLHSIPDEIKYLTAVTSLKLIECGDLVVLPKRLQLLSSLKSFTIQSCNFLESFPAMGIPEMRSSIVVLDIVYCNSLISLSEGLRYLSSLETLIIGVCTQLEFSREDFQHLISLRRLQLDSLTMLISIPDMQSLTALQYFVINNCENLWIIPKILGLTALQSLKIYRCKNMRMLPEGLQHLTYLHSLEIFKCHLDLHERVKEKGEDWPKIFHIQNLSIGP